MKKILTIVALVIGLLAMSASAQVPGKPFTVYAGAGVSPLSGDFGELWKMGFHGMGKVGFSVAPKIELRGGVEYHMFPLDIPSGSSASGGTLSSLMFGADVKVDLSVPGVGIGPFLFGGAGLASVSASDLTGGGYLFTFPTETKVYFEFGGGLNFSKMFIQGKYVSVSTEGSSMTYIPLTIGFKF